MREILKKIQVHVPFYRLRTDLLPMVIREGINPEIAFSHRDLDRFAEADFREIADRLADAGLSVTFHAPFLDLRPGAIEPKIRQVTVERLRRVFELIPWFLPRSIVCHPSFDEKYYISCEQLWLENSLETWRCLLGYVQGTGTIIAMENVYERGPQQIRPLLDALDSPACSVLLRHRARKRLRERIVPRVAGGARRPSRRDPHPRQQRHHR